MKKTLMQAVEVFATRIEELEKELTESQKECDFWRMSYINLEKKVKTDESNPPNLVQSSYTDGVFAR